MGRKSPFTRDPRGRTHAHTHTPQLLGLRKGLKVGGAASCAMASIGRFFSIERAERWRLLTDLRRRLLEVRVAARARIQLHDAASHASKEREKKEEERKDINRRLKAEQLSMVQPATTAAALASLSRVEDLHDQIRVRKYCYGIPWKQLPSIGKDRGEGAVARLRRELTNVVLTQLPPRVASSCNAKS